MQPIGSENPVRVIDALVDALDLEPLGFELKGKSVAGRPAFTLLFARVDIVKPALTGGLRRLHEAL